MNFVIHYIIFILLFSQIFMHMEGIATCILVVPNWPSQFWFTVLQELFLTEAFIILPNADNFYLPNQNDLKNHFP